MQVLVLVLVLFELQGQCDLSCKANAIYDFGLRTKDVRIHRFKQYIFVSRTEYCANTWELCVSTHNGTVYSLVGFLDFQIPFGSHTPSKLRMQPGDSVGRGTTDISSD